MKSGDEYKSKPQIAIEIIQELKEWGFKIKLVLADSLYGESGFNIPGMKRCFLKLIGFMNDFRATPISFPIAS